jgi:hypothetical protein
MADGWRGSQRKIKLHRSQKNDEASRISILCQRVKVGKLSMSLREMKIKGKTYTHSEKIKTVLKVLLLINKQQNKENK